MLAILASVEVLLFSDVFAATSCTLFFCRSEDHDTCPVCREKLEDADESWILSEIPKMDEISKEIKSELITLASTKEKIK